MAAIWFTLSVIFVLVSLVVLQVDRKRRLQRRKLRAVWGARRGLGFARATPKLAQRWRYGVIGAHSLLEGRNVVSGVPRTAPSDQRLETILFDLDDACTVIGVKLPEASAVVFEMARSDIKRSNRKRAGQEPVRVVAEVGDRFVLSTDPDVARRAADLRLVSFADSLPSFVETIWIEGDWVLAGLPQGTGWHEWDLAEHALHRFGDIMSALPRQQVPVNA